MTEVVLTTAATGAKLQTNCHRQHPAKSNTVKQLWNNLYKVCNFKEGKSKNTKYTVPILKINNDNISDPQSICNEFNRYFQSLGETLAKSDSQNSVTNNNNNNNTFKQYCKPQISSMYCESIDEYEITEIIQNLKICRP